MDIEIEAHDGSVAASEIIKSYITTGNNSPIFVGRYESLKSAFIQPGEVFRRVRIESFVGRKWLIDQVDSILRDKSCGYLVLEAKAGMGKTAFLAWLVKERNYINHFVELAPGQDGIERGLKNLAAQLIIAYNLSTEGVLPDAAARPDYLYELLSRAAEKRRPSERIVVVVDALDEAGTPPHQNVLGLPKVLPEGVFFIVSMREVPVMLQVDISITPCLPLKILSDSEENKGDLRSFLKASASWPKVAKALKESEYTTEEFIDTLKEKSQGLWIYLQFVIFEIENSDEYQLDLDALPKGLPKYYAGYWSRWRKDEKWYDLYLPILTALAAAQEASSFDRILDWAGVGVQGGERSRLKSVLKEQWRPFLAISGEGKNERYRFYHATVREFFEGKVEQSLLQPEIDLVNELSEATSEMHRMIAERYLVAWGGLEKGLPDLENKKREGDGDGMRHLAAHLEASGQQEKLHCLLNLETRQGRNLWHEAKEAGGDTTGYINDIMRAWRLAEKGYDPKDIEKTGHLIGLQIRYALIFASINSLSGNIPSELLLALVENGIWSKEEGLAHARHIPDLYERSTILTKLSSLMKETKFLDEALEVARKIEGKQLRAIALANIASNLQDSQKRDVLYEALVVARRIQDKESGAYALAEIALNLEDAQKRDLLYEALAVIRKIQYEVRHASALAGITSNLRDVQDRDVLYEALEIAREIQDEWLRANALAEIAPNLQDDQEALAVAREIQDERSRARALAKIAPNLQDDKKWNVLDEALAAARKIQVEWWRASALAEIAPNLEDAQERDVLDEALSVAREIQGERFRAIALAKIVPRLQDDQDALVVAEEIQDERFRAIALAEIVPRLQDDQKRIVLGEALAVVRKIQDEGSHAIALAEIAPRLQDAQKNDVLDDALAVARKIQDEGSRAIALAEIAPNLQDTQESDALDEALAIVRKIQNEGTRAITLAEIAPNLQDDQEMLAVAQEIQDEWSRAIALANIVPHLQDAQEALAIARKIQYRGLRVIALAEIAPNLQDDQKKNVLYEALTVARKIQDEESHASALAKIAPHLQNDQEMLAVAREIEDEWFRANALAEIAPNLQDDQEALAVAREIQDERFRARALAKIAPNLQNAQKKNVLDEALTVAREIQDEGTRASALGEITLGLLAQKAFNDFFPLWSPTIHGLSSRSRSDLLSDLSSLTPLVSRLGGDDALLETVRAIKDVGRWWP